VVGLSLKVPPLRSSPDLTPALSKLEREQEGKYKKPGKPFASLVPLEGKYKKPGKPFASLVLSTDFLF
jgi:hypothetical protein